MVLRCLLSLGGLRVTHLLMHTGTWCPRTFRECLTWNGDQIKLDLGTGSQTTAADGFSSDAQRNSAALRHGENVIGLITNGISTVVKNLSAGCNIWAT